MIMMNLDLQNTIIVTVLGGLAVSFISVIIRKLYTSLVEKKKRIKEVKAWQENQIAKLVSIDGSNQNIEIVKSNLYVSTMGQIDGPHNSDDIIVISKRRFDLVENLLNSMLKSVSSIGKKRYLILGGSGMGKTIFSSALCYKYINKYNNKIPYPFYYFHLGKKDILKEIEQLRDDNIHQASIILDALDENVDANYDYQAFFNNLLSVTSNFKIVIITCRTQFFFDSKNEPVKDDETDVNNPSKEQIPIEHIFISPFNKEETEKYLENKFGSASDDFKKANTIINQTNDLMSRPLLLSYIDDLIGLENNTYYISSELYMCLIESWLKRECNNQTKREKSLTTKDLFDFSKKIALHLYNIYQKEGRSYLSHDEFNQFIRHEKYDVDPKKFTQRSLLNRKDDGTIKFSHKSFWEFFLAINSIENPGLSFSPKTFSLGAVFAEEIQKLYLLGNQDRLPFINYFCPNIIVDSFFSDIVVTEKLNQIKASFNKSKKNSAVKKSICSLWEELLRRKVCQEHNMEVYAILLETLVRDSDPDSKTKERMLSYAQRLRSSVYDCNSLIQLLHDIIISDQSNHLQGIITLSERIISDIIDYDQYAQKVDIQIDSTSIALNKFNKVKETVVFPDIITFSDEIKVRVLCKRFISIGQGFNNKESIIGLVKYIVQHNLFNPDLITQTDLYIGKIKCIGIYQEGNNLNDYISFILDLQKVIKDKEYSIILQLVIQGKKYYYYISSDSKGNSREQIDCFLNNMIKVNN